VGQVTLDSLQRVYSYTASQLDELQKSLTDHNLTGIPDSDISLKDIEKKKLELNKQLNKLHSLRSKKIIHL
jgi:hypothetical protein